MRELRIRKLAQQDIQEIVDYYDAFAPHIADRFLDILYKELDTINSIRFYSRSNTITLESGIYRGFNLAFITSQKETLLKYLLCYIQVLIRRIGIKGNKITYYH